ncbi:hypothetical protein J2Z72_001677 [Peptostreptococcus canis]|nr:hypothetical protein [Peptostreptococcus canis]
MDDRKVRNYVEAFKFALLILIEYVAQYLRWANS